MQVSKVDIFPPQGLARGGIVAFRSSPYSLHAQHKTIHSNPKSRAIARELLQQDTRLKLKPEELFMLKEGKGEPLDLMRKYYGRSMMNLDEFLDNAAFRGFTNADEAATTALKEIELIPQFAQGGLARILEL